MQGMQIMNLSDKRVLFTGATGLIGKEAIKPLIDNGFDVYAINRNATSEDIHWIKSDLFDNHNIKAIMQDIKPQYLLNMAWCTTGDYLTSDLNYRFLNSGINLLQCFSENGGKRAVFAGTCFEYKFKDAPLKESDDLDPNKTVYTFCKNKLRETAEYFCEKHNISFGWGRIFYVYGHNEDKTRLTAMVIDKLSKNEPVIIKSGDLQKDYMYSKDIANAFVRFLDSDVTGVVNVCTGKAIYIHDYVLEIARMMGKENLVVFQNQPSNQPPVIVGDNSRLTKEVGYTYNRNMKEALRRVLNSAKSR